MCLTRMCRLAVCVALVVFWATHVAAAEESGATDAELLYQQLRTSSDRATQRLAERWYGLVRFQEWTDASGKFRTNAKYVEHDPDLKWVKLRAERATGGRRDVKDLTVPLERLDETCQSRVRQIRFLEAQVRDAAPTDHEAQAAAPPAQGEPSSEGLAGVEAGGRRARSHTRAGKRSADQAYFSREGDSICLGNRFLEMRFSAQNGELQSLGHKKSGVDLKLEKMDCWHTIWGIGIYTKDKQRSWTDNARSGDFFALESARAERKGNELKLHLYWNGIRLENGEQYPARVHATISVYNDSPFSDWGISIQNRGRYAIEKVAYPFISGIKELGDSGSDDCLIVPTLEGRLYHDPNRNLKHAGNSYPSCFLNMQFVAYYDGSSGFYFACYDSQGNIKSLSFDRQDQSWSTMSFEHRPSELRFGADVEVSYPVTVGVFEGDWYTAANIYRHWAVSQSWAKQTLKERKLPGWLTDCGAGSCFVTKAHFKKDYTSFEGIRQLAINHQRYSGTELLTEVWGWENKGAWSWGDYFPPLEGWASFDELVADFHANRCRLCTYIGASSLSQSTDLWKSQRPLPFAKRNESGELVGEMCPATQYWQEHLQATAVELAKHKVDLIQFDCLPKPPMDRSCYATNHGHPPGIGKWDSDAWLKILSTTEAACREVNPDVCFTSEGVAEIYIPYLDVGHYWRDVFSEVGLRDRELLAGTAEIIPLFEYVYHDYCVSQGQHYLALLSPHPEYNVLCMGRMLVWGEIPLQNTWARTEIIQQPALKLWKRIGEARTSYAKDFLVYGRMQCPLEFTCPLTTVPLKNTARDIDPAAELHVPSVMHSAWRAPDGDSGFVFLNVAKGPVPLRLSLDFHRLGLKPGAEPFLYCVRDGTYSILRSDSNSATVAEITLQPCEIVLLGLCEVGGERATQVRRLLPAE